MLNDGKKLVFDVDANQIKIKKLLKAFHESHKQREPK